MAAAETKPSSSTIEHSGDSSMGTSPSTKPTLFSRWKAHMKRWWWLHLLIFCAVVLIITLPVVYVGYPRIAQSDVNDSTLNITSLIMTDPTPNSFRVNQTQVIGTGSSYHPNFSAFNASVGVAGSGAVFAYINVPPLQVYDGTTVHVVQEVELTDQDAFRAFVTASLVQETVGLNIYGRPDLKLGALPTTTVTYNKTVELTGLNGLKGFNVTSFDINLSPLPDGYNMHGIAYIPNPSVLSIAMGNLTFDLSVNGTAIGQSFINNLTLVPGNNTVPLASNVSQITVLDMITGPDAPYKNGLLPVDIKGNRSEYNGQELPYFTEALSANVLSVTLNVGAALEKAINGTTA